MLFADAASVYLADKRRRVRASTLAGYESALRVHVLPRWGQVEVGEIDASEIQAWVDSFQQPGAAEKAYKTLRQVIRWAIRRLGLRVYDPTSQGVELPRKAPHEPRVLAPKATRELLRGLWGSEIEAVVLCAATLGLRRGEACALRWSDINFRTGEVRVRASRQVVAREVVEVEPKTERSRRTLVLPRFALVRLRSLRGHGLLCELRPDAVSRRLAAAMRRLGLGSTSMSELRHSWASQAIEAGVGIETVALLLGHVGISTAYEHYIRPRRTVCREAQRAWEALVMRA